MANATKATKNQLIEYINPTGWKVKKCKAMPRRAQKNEGHCSLTVEAANCRISSVDARMKQFLTRSQTG